jgi:hypothetical protein
MNCNEDKTVSCTKEDLMTIHHRERHTGFEDQRRLEEGKDLRIRLHHQAQFED